MKGAGEARTSYTPGALPHIVLHIDPGLLQSSDPGVELKSKSSY
jgi:hypothetical protein